MTLLKWSWPSKKTKSEWLANREAKLEAEFQNQLREKGEHLAKLLTLENERIEELEKRVADRKADLERVNEELKIQIRLIEAKSSPDSIWTSAFSQGFSKAWDMMVPIQLEGISKIKEKIRTQSYEECLGNLDSTIMERLDKIEKSNLRPTAEIASKRNDISTLLKSASNEIERLRYKHHLEALDWILNGNVLPKTE